MAETINISDLQLFNLLKPKLGEKEAEQLVSFVRSEAQTPARKQYKYFSKDIKTLADYLYQNFATKDDLFRKTSSLRKDLLKEISQSKVDMIKWMFAFWVTLVLLILANWFLKS